METEAFAIRHFYGDAIFGVDPIALLFSIKRDPIEFHNLLTLEYRSSARKKIDSASTFRLACVDYFLTIFLLDRH